MTDTCYLECPHCKKQIPYEYDAMEMDDTMCVLAAWENHEPAECEQNIKDWVEETGGQ